ncbi:MAG: cell division ATP-binding protein FtsE [Ignavibacteriaceae bacterium]
MLNFTNVEYSYSNQPIFSDLNFELNQGEFCFLIGKSGAGKSTLLQLIYMNILPNYGRISFDEYDSRTIKPRNLPLLRRKLGVIFQDFKLLKDRNIYENLSFVLEATNKSSGEIKKKVNDALTDVGLSHRRYSMPNELSGGEKQRIAIARAIINEPILILADEPTGNLDPETSLEILDILKKINARGTAVIFATHNYELLKSYNAKIFRIDDGRAVKVIMKTKQ